MSTESRKDDWLGTIAVVVLLIGTATGNAYGMLGMSVAALALIALFYRKQMGSGAILVTLVAAVTATVIGTVMAKR
jgi:NAD/NADP transhydrogenase beta subunit